MGEERQANLGQGEGEYVKIASQSLPPREHLLQ